MKTAIAIARTGVAMTQTAFPTATYTPTITPLPPTPIPPTPIPPEPTKIPLESYENKIDYAMDLASNIYIHLPFTDKAPYIAGEYSGCVSSYDFSNYITYEIQRPMGTVAAAFEKYLHMERWNFAEPTQESIENSNIILKTNYDVYRISSKGAPALERLNIILTSMPSAQGEWNHVSVRVELTHMETKRNFQFISAFYCFHDELWHWYSLHRQLSPH